VNASGPLFLAEVGQVTLVICGIGAFLFVFFLFIGIWASRYRKVGPDEVMIVSGRKYEMITPEGKKTFAGFRMVRGGGTFIWPIYEQAQTLSLKLIPLTFDRLAITAQDGKRLDVQAKGQIKIKGDDVSVMRAAQCLLSKSTSAIAEAASLIIESALRKLFHVRTADDAIRDADRLAEQAQSAAQKPLDELGLDIVGFAIVSVNKV